MATIQVSDDEKQNLVSFCRDYLSNDWNDVDLDDVHCELIPYGLSNKTYHCYIKSLRKKSEINDVVIHIFLSGVFGDKNVVKHLGEVAEIAIMLRLYNLSMAPKLYAVIPGGRIEEYIQGRPPTKEEYQSIDLCKAVIRKLAEYHSLDSMPVLKKPNFVENFYEIASKIKFTDEMVNKFAEEQREHCRTVINFPIETEFEWIKNLLPIVGYKIVFSHNDMNPNNVLMKDKDEDSIDKRLILIDYETSSYFYRGFDIAYFLNAKSIKPRSDGKRITLDFQKLDTVFKDELLNEYLIESKKIDENKFDEKYDNLERLRMEVDFFDFVYNFHVISLGKIILAYNTLIMPMEYFAKVANQYHFKKKTWIEKYGNSFELK